MRFVKGEKENKEMEKILTIYICEFVVYLMYC